MENFCGTPENREKSESLAQRIFPFKVSYHFHLPSDHIKCSSS